MDTKDIAKERLTALNKKIMRKSSLLKVKEK